MSEVHGEAAETVPNPIGSPLPPRQPALLANRMKEGEYTRHIWVVAPEPGTPYKALFDRGYWAHVASKLRPWDRIDVHYEDAGGAVYAELIVRAAGRNWAQVAELRLVDLSASAAKHSASDDYAIEFDTNSGYRVVRTTDMQTLMVGLPTRDLAETWITNHRSSGTPVQGRIS